MRVLVTGSAGPVQPDGAWPGPRDPRAPEPAAAGGGTHAPTPREVATWWFPGRADAAGATGATAVPVALAASRPAFLDALAGVAPELLAAVVPGEDGTDVPVAVRRDPRTATVYVDASQVPAVGGTTPAPRSSAALGHLLAHAADAARTPDGRPGRVVVATGGARSHDAGAGLLGALAGRVPSGHGPTTAETLRSARSTLGGAALVAAVATDAPLLGLHGTSAALAARGVDDAVAQDLERRLGAVAHDVGSAVETLDREGLGAVAGRDLLAASSSRRLATVPGTGSGGGAAFALAALGGRLVPALAVVADAVGLDAHLAAADLVVVVVDELAAHELGEGVVHEVARRAARHALPVVVVARTVVAGRREQAAAGLSGAHAWGDGSARALVERVARTWSRA
ncbi:glycerate kinase [Cellulosimicrobium sp. NPDC057127]|uniref:glycerate kinase n=1 Tax=Cellulosimicrobium sp. NPDC057127 TaxID=3346026 RepID=UPI0036403699